jgi:hypothetical protein
VLGRTSAPSPTSLRERYLTEVRGCSVLPLHSAVRFMPAPPDGEQRSAYHTPQPCQLGQIGIEVLPDENRHDPDGPNDLQNGGESKDRGNKQRIPTIAIGVS